MQDDVVQKVLNTTYTKADFYKRMALLREFLEHLFYQGDEVSSGDRMKSFLEYEKQSAEAETVSAVEAWGGEVFNAFSAKQVYDQLDELTHTVENMPELVLYAPVPLTEPHITAIGSWCRVNIDKRVLLQLEVDSAVVGGCAFVWQNTRYDFSLSHFLYKHRQELIGAFQTYGNAK